jgi:hypothetical protein
MNSATTGGQYWDAKDFRINELAWRFWPWAKQLSTRSAVLKDLSVEAASRGLRVALTGEGACPPLLYGHLSPTTVDTVVFEHVEQEIQKRVDYTKVMIDGGFTLIHETPTALFFERSLRLIMLKKDATTHSTSGLLSRTIAMSNESTASITASPTAKEVTLYLAHRIKRRAKYVFDHISWRTISRITRRETISLAVWLLRVLSLDSRANALVARELTLDEFLALSLADDNELNTLMRSAHFNLVTNGGTLQTLGAITDFLKDERNRTLMTENTRDPVPIELSAYPRHLDRAFWDNGNASLFNAILAQFRQGVVPYAEMISMQIEDGPALYSLAYYDGLPEMSDDEIARLLRENPILVHDRAVGSGRHRVCAMIGRLAAGREYIPIWVLNSP